MALSDTNTHADCRRSLRNRLRHKITKLAFVLAAVVSLQLISAPGLFAERPNVLLIMTDDQGYGDLSLHGNPHLATPHLDRLGQSSVQFERFFVNSFCAPTRAALLTGRWPLRCGVHGVTHNKEAMKPSEVTLGEAFLANGYRTACIGKWHNGEQYPYTPPGQGFETFFGFNNGHWNNYFDATLLRGATPEPTQGYITDVLTDEAIRFVGANQSQPFFCYLSYNAPHSPYQVPHKYYDKFRAAGFDEAVSGFWGMCENIDDNIGRLLAQLDALQLTDNTIVIFLTDNGGTAGRRIYNAGMRGGKVSVHEGGSRVPLFVRWPKANWEPHTVKPLTSHIDLYPTLMDLCQITPPDGPKVDGITLRPYLEDSTITTSDRILFTHNPISETNRYPGAVRTPQYRLVCEIKGPSGGSSAKPNDKSAKPWQLYDMLADPGQKNNIAKNHPELVAELSQKYEQWYDDISSDGISRPAIPIGYTQHNPVELHAPQAYYDQPLHFHSGPGFSNDWLTNWTTADAKIWFEITVAKPGLYSAEVAYSCPDEAAGSQLTLDSDSDTTTARVPAAPPVRIELPHPDQRSRDRYQNRHWATLPLGTLRIGAEDTRLTLQASQLPGGEVLDFKHLRLTRISD